MITISQVYSDVHLVLHANVTKLTHWYPWQSLCLQNNGELNLQEVNLEITIAKIGHGYEDLR